MDRTENDCLTYIKNIQDFKQQIFEQIKSNPKNEVVLLLGNTGSGKSTLTLYISGNDDMLSSEEAIKGIGDYIITDEQNKIISNSTIVSQTIYPDLVKERKTNTLYYDCPGFSDTRSTSHEIAATCSIKQAIDSSKSVKIIFVVSYHSVTRGADRQDFVRFLQHAAVFIKEIKKFENSIALVVTKVENRYVDNKLVQDEIMINAIGCFIEKVMQDIIQYPEIVNSPGHTSDNFEKCMALLKIFLSRGENKQYTRIGIFRKPNEAGPLTRIKLMNEGQNSLRDLINIIKFKQTDENDFGYTISAKAQVHINFLVEEINKYVSNEILIIGNVVKEWCTFVLEKTTSDTEYLNQKFKELLDFFSKIQSNAINCEITCEEFIIGIRKNIESLGIEIRNNYSDILEKVEFINFLHFVSNHSIRNDNALSLGSSLSNLIEYLADSLSFYSLLNSLYQRLSQYDIQKQKKYYKININQFNDFPKFPFYKEIEGILKAHICCRELIFNEFRSKLLNRVLDESLNNNYETIENKSELQEIVIKGENIVMSDLRELHQKDFKLFKVYALHKVFIDTTFDFTGREVQMVIVAPVWEVIGNQRIILDGKPGIDHKPYNAKNGTWNEEKQCSEHGFDGDPGEPGGPAGDFIGIGKLFINESCLEISANGGLGGKGQNGGNGGDGSDEWFFSNICRDGGKGGDGGNGGYGGHKGAINIIRVGKEPGGVLVKQIAEDGLQGENGKGGKGGRGGRHSELQFYLLFNFIPFIRPFSTEKSDKTGQPGKTGANKFGRMKIRQLTRIINVEDSIMEYISYFSHNPKNHLKEIFLTNFLEEINNHHKQVKMVSNSNLKAIGSTALQLVKRIPMNFEWN